MPPGDEPDDGGALPGPPPGGPTPSGGDGLWLALAARFEATGGHSTEGIFREPAESATLERLGAQLFPAAGADAGQTEAEAVLTEVSDPHVVGGLLKAWCATRSTPFAPRLPALAESSDAHYLPACSRGSDVSSLLCPGCGSAAGRASSPPCTRAACRTPPPRMCR